MGARASVLTEANRRRGASVEGAVPWKRGTGEEEATDALAAANEKKVLPLGESDSKRRYGATSARSATPLEERSRWLADEAFSPAEAWISSFAEAGARMSAAARIKVALRECAKRIADRGERVDLVFSSPPFLGLEEFCDALPTRAPGFVHADVSAVLATAERAARGDETRHANVCSIERELRDLDEARTQAMTSAFDAGQGRSSATALVHAVDLMRDMYARELAQELAPAQAALLRVHHRSAVDHVNAGVHASCRLGYVEQPFENKLLELLGKLAWRMSMRDRSDATTLHVYVRVSDEAYLGALDAFYRRHESEDHASPTVAALLRLKPHALIAKRLADEFYDRASTEAQAGQASLVLRLEDGASLLSDVHADLMCLTALHFVDVLQKEGLWSGTLTDAERQRARADILQSTTWRVARICTIPRSLAPERSSLGKMRRGTSAMPLSRAPAPATKSVGKNARPPVPPLRLPRAVHIPAPVSAPAAASDSPSKEIVVPEKRTRRKRRGPRTPPALRSVLEPAPQHEDSDSDSESESESD